MPQTRRFLDLSSGTVERGSPRRGIRGEQKGGVYGPPLF